MDRRLSLHEKLVEILGSEHVYFQPPTGITLNYPCIVYNLDTGDTQFADDKPYVFMKRYQVVYIDRNPDSDVPNKLAGMKLCVMDRSYTSDNLYHTSFNIYY